MPVTIRFFGSPSDYRNYLDGKSDSEMVVVVSTQTEWARAMIKSQKAGLFLAAFYSNEERIDRDEALKILGMPSPLEEYERARRGFYGR
jgi:hypothetical protein